MYALVLCVIISGRAALFICKCKLLQHERKRDWKITKKEESNGIKIVKIVEREREREREREILWKDSYMTPQGVQSSKNPWNINLISSIIMEKKEEENDLRFSICVCDWY